MRDRENGLPVWIWNSLLKEVQDITFTRWIVFVLTENPIMKKIWNFEMKKWDNVEIIWVDWDIVVIQIKRDWITYEKKFKKNILFAYLKWCLDIKSVLSSETKPSQSGGDRQVSNTVDCLLNL